jgi:hypothetical protein
MDGNAITLEATYRGCPITFEALPRGEDLLVVLTGGEKPHIGSVVLAEPRPSTADASRLSVTTQVWNRPPHKEESVARPVAETIAQRLGLTVVVVSGIHYDELDADGLEAVRTICNELLDRFLATVSID